jgi:GH35 family endo-1,4-beta-xylanase
MKTALRVTCLLITITLGWVRFLPAQTLTESEILSQANARIQKYRTGNADLRLLGPDGKPLKKGARVEIQQTRHSFLFGSNIFMLGHCNTPEANAGYEKRFSDLFNYATVPFYWWAYERQAGQPNYDDSDRIATWCADHNITMKGHPLAWNYVDPSWLPADPGAAMQLQMQRISDIVGRFKDQIRYFDVVNEATRFSRPETLEHAPKLTEAIQQMGVQNYLRAAFNRAREANPQATLVINDYVTTDEYVQKVISQLVSDSAQPLYDVIGIQCHQHRQAWSAQQTWEICERFAKLGKPLHFTEATLLSGELGWELQASRPGFDWASTPEGELRQAKEVAQFYTILFSHPAVQAITWWDLSDQGAWQDAPAGLVRDDMTPKPAYDVLMNLIKGQWWTHAKTRTTRDGVAEFHGFYGDYKVTVWEHGKELTGTFTFDAKTAGPLEVKLN